MSNQVDREDTEDETHPILNTAVPAPSVPLRLNCAAILTIARNANQMPSLHRTPPVSRTVRQEEVKGRTPRVGGRLGLLSQAWRVRGSLVLGVKGMR